MNIINFILRTSILPICFVRNIWVDFNNGAETMFNFQCSRGYSFDGLVYMIQESFYKYEWYKKYDLIEFIISIIDSPREFISECNAALLKYNSAYRIVYDKVVSIIDDEQIKTIESCIQNTSSISEIQKHIKTAIARISDRPEPDLRNAIKESISAVEGICCKIVKNPKATLGQALSKIKELGIDIHPALLEGWNKIYGYTSDSDGIRHKLMEDSYSQLTIQDAIYFCVSCSAFINLLIDKADRLGVFNS